ncbi:MAG: hypothetical protein ABR95_07650 [Sphingobacteriales bacterium BACL12 MAG-120813-bin55]|nr:MAG: hypothetical protein ABR95_07650 [Sphingobacteriales bacterium BACL12 MAG-120813-bin55]
MQAQTYSEAFERLPFGSIKPSGWIKTQIENDVNGFVGKLDQLVPDLLNDPIYSTDRLHKNSIAKELGNLKEGDAEGDEQYKWWNSETQSNWWDGYIRNVLLLDNQKDIEKVKRYIIAVLATQDEDGYLGIYDAELRYQFESENGELWSKATLYRGLLAYYEYSGDQQVVDALVRAVENVMENYPINASSPFSSGTGFNGGVSHGLTFTDVLDRLYQLTGEKKYQQYALFLYNDFSNTYQTEADVQLANILNPDYRLKAHGVHTFEHIRPLIVATFAAQSMDMDNALQVYLDRIRQVTTITGGAIGDEWIAERMADATHTGYEYCSLHELLDSYTVLMQKTGQAMVGDQIENLFYNAAQGSRNPAHSCIAYLKTDNSYEMLGTKNGEIEPDRKQTRYKYSPAHQDVAVCCSPNAGRITPYFLQSSWMKEGDNTLVATLLMPNVLETEIGASRLVIENKTEYPYGNQCFFAIHQEKASRFSVKIRIPEWVSRIETEETYTIDQRYLIINRMFEAKDSISLTFHTEVQVATDAGGAHYFKYGALVFALPIAATEIIGKTYAAGFSDYTYTPLDNTRYSYTETPRTFYKEGKIYTELVNEATQIKEQVELVPIGETILRQTTFH